MKLHKFCLIIVCIFLFGLELLHSQVAKSGWWILRRPASTKPKSLTAVATVRGDLSGIFYNPSVIATILQRELFLITEILGLAEDSFGSIIYGQPLTEKMSFAVGVINYDAGKAKLYWIEEGKLKQKEVTLQNDILGIISGGYKINERFYGGVNLKYVSSNIADAVKSHAVAVDIGALCLLRNINLSFTIQNLGTSTKFLHREESLPTTLWFGTVFTLSDLIFNKSFLNIGLDNAYLLKENVTTQTIGIEYGIGHIGVNFGYRFSLSDIQLDSVFHFGLCFNHRKFNIGYAFIPAVNLSNTHRLTLGIKF